MTLRKFREHIRETTASITLPVLFALFQISTPPPLAATLSGPACGRDSVRVIGEKSFVELKGIVLEVDSVTVACTGCHDGTVARSVAVHDNRLPPTSALYLDTKAQGGNHPVGIHYPLADPTFVNVGDLDPRLALAGGKVTCLTCHQDEPSQTPFTIPLTRSRLCLSCHMK